MNAPLITQDNDAGQLLQMLATLAQRPSDSLLVKDWLQQVRRATPRSANSVDHAAVMSCHARHLADAFIAGYETALNVLIPQPSADKDFFAALCVSEVAGNHPRKIATRLSSGECSNDSESGMRLNGSKTFITGGCDAEVLYVACVTGQEVDGHPELVMLKLPADRAGITRTPLECLPFVPEVQHASVVFEQVEVKPEELLPGDGYGDYVKPFRTIEDIHVGASVLGYLCSIALRDGWPQAVSEQLLALILAHRQLAGLDCRSPLTHLAYAGVRTQVEALMPAIDQSFACCSTQLKDNWFRDKALLHVASSAREARRQRAWSTNLIQSTPAAGQ